MITITRRFEFDAAHRVLGHEGKCRFLHGHRYVAEVTVSAEDELTGKVGSSSLDSLGCVVDFSVVKEKVGKWIDDNWDHNLLINPYDPIALAIMEEGTAKAEFVGAHILGGRRPYEMPYWDEEAPRNPTAENIARDLFEVSTRLFDKYQVRVVCVRVYETPNCWADYNARQIRRPSGSLIIIQGKQLAPRCQEDL
jgi:6-pyruvoyltetrahydropterin/6-carboxytetrahydropterin synthase